MTHRIGTSPAVQWWSTRYWRSVVNLPTGATQLIVGWSKRLIQVRWGSIPHQSKYPLVNVSITHRIGTSRAGRSGDPTAIVSRSSIPHLELFRSQRALRWWSGHCSFHIGLICVCWVPFPKFTVPLGHCPYPTPHGGHLAWGSSDRPAIGCRSSLFSNGSCSAHSRCAMVAQATWFKFVPLSKRRLLRVRWGINPQPSTEPLVTAAIYYAWRSGHSSCGRSPKPGSGEQGQVLAAGRLFFQPEFL